MHDHDAGLTVLMAVYVVANVIIAAGYAAMPILVLRFIRLDRRTLFAGAGFFALCGTTHLVMGLDNDYRHVSVWWTIEHVAQALFTWSFLILFSRLLARATRRREQRRRVTLIDMPGGTARDGAL